MSSNKNQMVLPFSKKWPIFLHMKSHLKFQRSYQKRPVDLQIQNLLIPFLLFRIDRSLMELCRESKLGMELF